MRRLPIAALCVVFPTLCTNLIAQDHKILEPAPRNPDVVKDLVKGSIHHRPHGKEVEWERITGTAQVINPAVLLFSDGTQIELGSTPVLNKKDTKEATEFLRKLVSGELLRLCGRHEPPACDDH